MASAHPHARTPEHPDLSASGTAGTAPLAASTTAASAPSAPSAHQLRAATTGLFALSGFVFGSWAARLPDIHHQVGATTTTLGVALLCLSLGALVSMPLAGALSARIGAGLVSAIAAGALSVAAVVPGLVTSVTGLAVVLLGFGAATGAVNVGANSLGVEVERRLGTSVLPSLHAGFSFGGLAGALVGGLAGAVAQPAPHLLIVSCAGLLLTAAVSPTLVRSDGPVTLRRPVVGSSSGRTQMSESGRTQVSSSARTQMSESGRTQASSSGRTQLSSSGRTQLSSSGRTQESSSGRTPGSSSARVPLVMLGAMAGSTAFAEGALTDWGALHLRETLAATPVIAAAGYAGFSLAMGIGRLFGGRLVARAGDTPLLVGGGLVAAVGLLAAALSPSVPLALGGFLLVGLGLANVFPLAIARAGARAGSSGVALASTVGYTGLLGGPPLIGFLAEHAGLPTALASISVLAVAAAALAVATDAHASPAALKVWAGAGSMGPALLRAVAVRSGPSARRHAEDLTILFGDTSPARPATAPAGGTAEPRGLQILLG